MMNDGVKIVPGFAFLRCRRVGESLRLVPSVPAMVFPILIGVAGLTSLAGLYLVPPSFRAFWFLSELVGMGVVIGALHSIGRKPIASFDAASGRLLLAGREWLAAEVCVEALSSACPETREVITRVSLIHTPSGERQEFLCVKEQDFGAHPLEAFMTQAGVAYSRRSQ